MPRDSKTLGAYFTPEAVAGALVRWAVRDPADLLLDPSSGDGRFVALHSNSVGVERDPVSVAEAVSRAPHATIIEADFFTWASDDSRRFDCAAGNPPFIRYQRFTGATRRAALDYCRRLGVTFSGLSSSWAPFIVAAASKLRPGGRIAFVVPAEIGHAPYAMPLLDYLVGNFGAVHVVTRKGKRLVLVHDPGVGGGGERTVYGGLKTKSVDVVVTKEGIGPVLAVSCKGAIGAFRNLTNRMEEAVGDCTNLHIAYPPLVCGYLFVMRANRAEEVGRDLGVDEDGSSGDRPPRKLTENDVALDDQGRPVESIRRFHAALRELADRRGIRDDVSSYEAIAFALASTEPARAGDIVEDFPEPGGALRFDRFFDSLYRQYDERFVYAAPDLRKVTARREWDAASPVFEEAGPTDLDYEPRKT